MAQSENSSPDWRELVNSNYCDLLNSINNQSGMEGVYKRQQEFYTPLQVKMIWGKRDNIERNKLILDFITKGNEKKFNAFLEALRETNQDSIVEILTGVKKRSEFKKPIDERYSRTLSKEKRKSLWVYWNKLIEDIDCNELIPRLGGSKVLTEFQFNKVRDMDGSIKQITYLLKILEVGSEGHFDDFCDYLSETNQDHIVRNYLTPSNFAESVKVSLLLSEEIKAAAITALVQENREKRRREINMEEAYGVSNGRVKGRVFVISNEFFVNLDSRKGTECDQKNLENFFKEKLNFSFETRTDLSANEIKTELKEESKKLGEFDIFILFILTHGACGSCDKVYGMDDEPVLVNDILKQFDGKHCPGLAGKPKLFFIQACRTAPPKKEQSKERIQQVQEAAEVPGSDVPDAIPVADPETSKALDCFSNEGPVTIVKPHYRADMVVFFATVKGDAACRSTTEGSHFVQCLLSVFIMKSHEEDVMSMVTQAMRLLHDFYPKSQVEKKKSEQGRQLGDTTGMLLKKLYFLV